MRVPLLFILYFLYTLFVGTEAKVQMPQAGSDLEETSLEQKRTVFVFVLLLGLEVFSFLLGFIIKATHFKYLPEAGTTLILGAGFGAALRILSFGNLADDLIKSLIQFNPEFFFLVLLPPIIFESGYNMSRKAFFANILSAVLFAFAGTTISAFITGGIMYIFAGVLYEITLIESLLFGAFISATDTVSVLAIFKELRVDPNLYSNVFGESVLNDAVAIVLYRTLLVFVDNPFSFSTVLGALISFTIIFCGSVVIGSVVALISALLFKHTSLDKHPDIESPLIVLFAYSSYLFAEGMKLSGIVSILFCGIVMAHYTRCNLSLHGKKRTTSFFELVASMSDTLTFIFLGLALFSFPHMESYNIPFTIVAIPACLIARAFNTFPLAYLANLSYKGTRKEIPMRYQVFMWWAGLRGGVAFVLAIGVPTEHAPYMFTTTLIIIFLSIIGGGGSLIPIILRLGIPNELYPIPEYPMPPAEVTDPSQMNWVESFDLNYMKPIFTRHKWKKVKGISSLVSQYESDTIGASQMVNAAHH